MTIDLVGRRAEAERLEANAQRLLWRSYHTSGALVASFAGLEIVGWPIPRTLWAIALLGLGNAGLGVSPWVRTRPRVHFALLRVSMVGGCALLLIVVGQLLRRIAT
jgi:hypothetical protein